MVPSQHTRGPLVVMLSTSLLPAFWGCVPRRGGGNAEGICISTSLPFASYIQAGLHESAGKRAQFFFPQLEIYDESGERIYSGHEAIENARVLRDLPNGVEALRSKLDGARLAEIMEGVPAFRGRKEEILAHHRPSVLSVSLEDCHACSLQEDALGSAEHQLLAHGINLLVIRVTRP